MAGHSKWANIKHRKAIADARRSKLWNRLIKEVSVAARLGSEAQSNPRLRLALEKATEANIPKENLQRAIARVTGEGGAAYEEVRYEGYGPGGIAVIVEALTDNRTRTVAEVRHAFSKHGGNLGQDNSVAFLFEARGVLSFDAHADEEKLLAAALEAGAEDLVREVDGSLSVLCAPSQLGAVQNALVAQGYAPESTEAMMRPLSPVVLRDEAMVSVQKLIDVLEDLDDVQAVFCNAQLESHDLHTLT